MSLIQSYLDTHGEGFARNEARMEGLAAELRERLTAVRQGGGAEATAKHRKRNKLTARERIDLLVDPGSDFLEFSALAANGMYDDACPAAGIVTGIGIVEGQHCVIVANDATVKGGTYYPMTVKKHLRAQEIAEQNHLPCIYLVDSGGAFLPLQDRGLPRSRPLRAHLLQPGAHVGQAHSADRRGDGIVHGRRRVRARDERRDRDRQGQRHDLLGRSAAGEGGDRRGSHRRGARRRRRAHAHLGRRRPSGKRRPARAGHRARDRAQPASRAPAPVGPHRAAPRRSTIRARTLRHHSRRQPRRVTTCAK